MDHLELSAEPDLAAQDGIEDKTNQEEDPDAPRTGQSRLRLRRAESRGQSNPRRFGQKWEQRVLPKPFSRGALGAYLLGYTAFGL